MDKVRMGIVGIGNMGASHAKNIIDGKVKGCELTALCDHKEGALKAFPDQKHFTDAHAMMDSGEIDAIIIATPHYDHTILGVAALEKGLHTLVEKPISVHKEDCEKLIAAHKDKSVVFAAMFNQRTNPAYQKLRGLIQSGQLGKVNRINWIITDWFRSFHYYASGGWRATWSGEGGGVLLNQCPHQIDLWQWMFGMPDKVRAFCHIGKHHDIEVEDDVTAYMEYDNGATGVFITTTGEAPGTNRLEVAAENGRVIIENSELKWIRNEVATTEHSKTVKAGFLKPSHWNIEIPINGSGEKHVGIMNNFCAAILEDKELIAPAEEGIHSVELANAMIFSSHKGETIDMPLNAADYSAFLKDKIANSTFKKEVAEDTGPEADMSSSF